MISSGQTIAGKYRINQLLGSGGMASVWSATNIFTERQFAIKFMLPAVARTPEAARRFLMEAKVSARGDHPRRADRGQLPLPRHGAPHRGLPRDGHQAPVPPDVRRRVRRRDDPRRP